MLVFWCLKTKFYYLSYDLYGWWINPLLCLVMLMTKTLVLLPSLKMTLLLDKTHMNLTTLYIEILFKCGIYVNFIQ